MTNYYSLLGILASANQDEIESAFNKFKRDIGRYNGGEDLKEEELKESFRNIYEAYEVLSDGERRKEYDMRLASIDQLHNQLNIDRGGRHKEEVYLIRYFPRWIINSFPRIFSYIAMVIFGILIILYLFLFMVSPSAGLHALPKILGYLALATPLVLILYHFKKVARWFFPQREMIFKEDHLYVKYPDGSLDEVRKIVLYRYIIREVLYINVFTEKGRIGFYHSLDSSFRMQTDKLGLLSYAQKASIPSHEKPFLFFNHWFEK